MEPFAQQFALALHDAEFNKNLWSVILYLFIYLFKGDGKTTMCRAICAFSRYVHGIGKSSLSFDFEILIYVILVTRTKSEVELMIHDFDINNIERVSALVLVSLEIA